MTSARIRRLLAVLAAVPLVLGLAACGDDDDDGTATGEAPVTLPAPADDGEDGGEGAGLEGSDEDVIVIEDFAFTVAGPVAQNKSVTISNKDDVEHTVTMDADGGFDVRVPGGEGEVFLAVQEPGEHPFHCEIHPTMKGVLVIEA